MGTSKTSAGEKKFLLSIKLFSAKVTTSPVRQSGPDDTGNKKKDIRLICFFDYLNFESAKLSAACRFSKKKEIEK